MTTTATFILVNGHAEYRDLRQQMQLAGSTERNKPGAKIEPFGEQKGRPPAQEATLTKNRSIPANKVDSVQVDARLLKGQETRERLRKNVQVFPAASVRERARMLGVSKSLVEKYLLEIQHRQQ